MKKPVIPDRSDEPAVRESLDKGQLSRTPVHSVDAARDAGQGPRGDAPGTQPASKLQKKPRKGEPVSDADADPNTDEVE